MCRFELLTQFAAGTSFASAFAAGTKPLKSNAKLAFLTQKSTPWAGCASTVGLSPTSSSPHLPLLSKSDFASVASERRKSQQKTMR